MRFIHIFFLLSILTYMTSCYSVRVMSEGVPGVNTQGNEEEVHTFHITGWQGEKIWDPMVCDGEGFHEVVYETNFLHSLANVISLGFWKPMKVRFTCKKHNPNE